MYIFGLEKSLKPFHMHGPNHTHPPAVIDDAAAGTSENPPSATTTGTAATTEDNVLGAGTGSGGAVAAAPQHLTSELHDLAKPQEQAARPTSIEVCVRDADLQEVPLSPRASDAELYRVGMASLIAITLHNFPEGLAAFLAVWADGRYSLPYTALCTLPL